MKYAILLCLFLSCAIKNWATQTEAQADDLVLQGDLEAANYAACSPKIGQYLKHQFTFITNSQLVCRNR